MLFFSVLLLQSEPDSASCTLKWESTVLTRRATHPSSVTSRGCLRGEIFMCTLQDLWIHWCAGCRIYGFLDPLVEHGRWAQRPPLEGRRPHKQGAWRVERPLQNGCWPRRRQKLCMGRRSSPLKSLFFPTWTMKFMLVVSISWRLPHFVTLEN